MPATEAIILNGTSSAGKSSIARCLQEILPGLWLTFGVDTLIQALPVAGSGIEFAADGAVVTGPEFQRLDATWSQGVATMVRAGTRIIIDEVFLSGAMSQRRWQEALEGSQTLWVGVHCTLAVATAREAARGDRLPGMAKSQAHVVHKGVTYDIEVDTSATDTKTCAQTIAAHVR